MDSSLTIVGLTLLSLMGLASGEGTCSYPSDSSVTDLTAKNLLVGTTLKYKCYEDHFAGIMSTLKYECENLSGVYMWISKTCNCHKYGDKTTNTEIGKNSNDCEISTTVNGTTPQGYCGPPPTALNAKLDLPASTFLVGQELHCSFLCDDHDQTRAFGVLKCQASSVGVDWIKLSDGCINKSSKSLGKDNGSYQNQVTNCAESSKSPGKDNGSHQNQVTNCAGMYGSCVCVSIGLITAIMVIFAIFKVAQWIIKSTAKRNTMSAQKDEEMNGAHVPLTEKQ
ncbi:uncharacterized protein [Dendropsophus ebraccatus]|uniref:uncharacterized protein n=1 Tax=Dendropsophus ebraccatus TaxID=150705 RepID=UPI00383182CB